GGLDDLFVFAHGWNAGTASAQATEAAIFTLLAEQLGAHRQHCAAVAIRWPSLLFPEDDPRTPKPTPSSGAMLASALAPAFPRSAFQLDQLGSLLDEQPPSMTELGRFHLLASSLVSSPSLALEDSGGAAVLSADTASLFGMAAAIGNPSTSHQPDRRDGYQSLWAGAREVLRILSYYEMKNRAGLIGRDGLGPLIASLRTPTGRPRIHLIGHSFGARLVAYALAGVAGQASIGQRSPIKSLSLIQGALSHFAFASSRPLGNGVHTGALAAFAGQVDGPILATFSDQDRLLGWWYPMASLLNPPPGQSADRIIHQWGAMGHDGLQGDRVSRVALSAVQAGYRFANGVAYSLDASAVIAANQSSFSGAHSDIAHPEVIGPIAAAAGFGPVRSADLPVTEHDPLRRGELGKSHRAAGV
ncbi:MAG: serine/threonine protein kinase, partial [Jatrophihabitantaceae bacterium]